MRKITPTKMLKPLPTKEYAFSAEKMLIPTPHFFINGTKPRAENPSARMTRLRFIENVCKRFFIANWEDGFVLKQVLCLPAIFVSETCLLASRSVRIAQKSRLAAKPVLRMTETGKPGMLRGYAKFKSEAGFVFALCRKWDSKSHC